MAAAPSQAQPAQMHPPYQPTTWTLGRLPEKNIDIPITAVFLALFVIGAVAHMTIFQTNRRRGHKFLMSGLLFGFCMARIATGTLRIASVSLPHDIPLAIGAGILLSAGVVIVYIVNLLFAQRIMRASHPNFGWHKTFSLAFKLIYVLIIISIFMVIIVIVQSFYTLNANTRRIARDIQLYALTFFAVVSFFPIPLVLFGLIIPRRHNLDKFGHGRWRSKIRILLISSVLISFGAMYRCVITWMPPVLHPPLPGAKPLPSYYHKAAFYIANLGVESVVVLMYAILRVDLRFHIPDGAHGHGSYSAGRQGPVKPDVDAATDEEAVSPVPPVIGDDQQQPMRFFTEEETFDEDEYGEAAQQQREKAHEAEGKGVVNVPDEAHIGQAR